ncbi:MAG: OmpA family protein [Bacteroidetes bacterium]|nr:MAG: OmpA family protein [Bacteroidota bacterium]
MIKKLQQKGFSNTLSSWKQTIFIISILLTMSFTSVQGQSYERKWNLGLLGGISVYAGDLGNGMTDFTSDVFKQNIIVGGTFSRYINPSFDVALMGTYGSWGYYKNGVTLFKGYMTHGNIHFKYKFNNGYLLKEESRLAPYIFVGAGMSDFKGSNINNGQDYPIIGGAGMRLRLSDAISINYQATYGYMNSAYNDPSSGVSPKGTDQFMFHTIGFGFNLGPAKDEDKDGISDKKDNCPNTPGGVKVDAKGCPLDGDGDGVMDYQDKCPAVVGDASTQGCPDTDKDGIADKDDQCPNEAGPATLKGCPDADGDGIIDSKDKCPNIKGTLALDGCPDKDGDGIRDEDDACPTVKGVALFKGCPDTDGDGIEDAKDMCPNLKGVLLTNGCPDTDNDRVHDGIDKCPNVSGSPTHAGCPDTDNDGVFDDIDNCVTIPGTAANKGCPELKKETKQLFQKALQGIQFETGKAVIKPISYPILNAIVKVMQENPSYKLNIGGHTDDVGEDEMNMTLSQDRASAVANYLISKGVNPVKVTASGYGETLPVDTNKSAKGRTRNRRVEFNVEFLEIVK